MMLSDFQRAFHLFLAILEGRHAFGAEVIVDLTQTLYPVVYSFGAIYIINIGLYFALTLSLRYYSKFYTNIGYLEGSYNLILTVLVFLNRSMLNPANIVGWLIALVQFYVDNKYVNLIAMSIPVVFTVWTALGKYNSDKQAHVAGSTLFIVGRNNRRYQIQAATIDEGDILEMKPGQCFPCVEGILTNCDASFDKYSVNGQCGTFEHYTVNSIIYENQIMLYGNDTAKIKITKVKGNGLENNQQKLQIEKTYNTWTYCSLILLVILCLDVQVSDFAYCIGETFLWSRSFILFLGVMIALNGVMPVMKIVLNMNFFNLLIGREDELEGVTSRKTYIKQKGELDIEQMKNLVLFSDKTGTLTQGKLKVNTIQIKNIAIVLAKLKVWRINNQLFSTSSLEEIRMASYMEENLKARMPSWTGRQNGQFSYQVGSDIIKIKTNHSTFQLGSHSMISFDGRNYYVVMYQRQVFEKLMGLNRPKTHLRALCMIYKETNLPLETEKLNYLESVSNNRELSGFSVLCQCYFDDPLRRGSIRGVRNLINKNVKFWMLTGDSVTTAKQISKDLYDHSNREYVIIKELRHLTQMNKSNTIIPVISGLLFEKLNYQEKLNFALELQHFKCGVLAQFKAKFKKQIVEVMKKINHQGIVAMLGDANNDYEALHSANISFAQKQGSKACKNISHVVIEDSNSVYEYLFDRRRYHLYGRWLFTHLFMMYNYIMGIICIVGLHAKKFQLKGILFVEPWKPLHSLSASFLLLILIILVCRFTTIPYPIKRFFNEKNRYNTTICMLMMISSTVPCWIVSYWLKHHYGAAFFESICIPLGIGLWVLHTIISMIIL